MKNVKRKKQLIIGIIVAVLILGLLIFNTHRENEKIAKFQTYLNGHKTAFNQYMIGKEETTYKSLIKQSNDAISFRNVKVMPELEQKLNALIEKAEKDNGQILNRQLEDLKSIDLNKIEKGSRAKIEDQIKEVEQLLSNKKYDSASKEIINIKNEMYSAMSTK